MKNPKAIRIQYAGCEALQKGERLIDLTSLQRFNGYDIGSKDINHLVLRDASVCPMHARIVQPQPGEFALLHLESGRKDSVSIGGQWLPVGACAPLPDGCSFNVGAVRLTFEILYHS